MSERGPRISWARSTIRAHRLRGYKLEFTPTDLAELAKWTDDCRVCGRALKWPKKAHEQTPDRPTLDRMDNREHLTINDVQVICQRCNGSKAHMTMDEFVKFCRLVASRHRH